MSIVPFIFWAGTVVAGIIIYVIVGSTIEKSGLERLGATGSLFSCDVKENKKGAL